MKNKDKFEVEIPEGFKPFVGIGEIEEEKNLLRLKLPKQFLSDMGVE